MRKKIKKDCSHIDDINQCTIHEVLQCGTCTSYHQYLDYRKNRILHYLDVIKAFLKDMYKIFPVSILQWFVIGKFAFILKKYEESIVLDDMFTAAMLFGVFIFIGDWIFRELTDRDIHKEILINQKGGAQATQK